ncbi:hypothetical protein JCM8547_005318 [Rhodosporidiobolus lusitaniae]
MRGAPRPPLPTLASLSTLISESFGLTVSPSERLVFHFSDGVAMITVDQEEDVHWLLGHIKWWSAEGRPHGCFHAEVVHRKLEVNKDQAVEEAKCTSVNLRIGLFLLTHESGSSKYTLLDSEELWREIGWKTAVMVSEKAMKSGKWNAASFHVGRFLNFDHAEKKEKDDQPSQASSASSPASADASMALRSGSPPAFRSRPLVKLHPSFLHVLPYLRSPARPAASEHHRIPSFPLPQPVQPSSSAILPPRNADAVQFPLSPSGGQATPSRSGDQTAPQSTKRSWAAL